MGLQAFANGASLYDFNHSVTLRMHLTPTAVALALALTPALAPAATVRAATPQTRPLAEALVKASDEREHWAQALKRLDDMLSAQIAKQLSITDVGEIAQVKQVVHDALSPVIQRAGDAMVDGYW